MLQKEMARRFSAQPSTKDYGALTLQVQFYYRVEYLRTIPATVFFPEPEVDSAIIAITPRPANEVPNCDYEFFMQLVRTGFSQRRKQLGKLIREEVPDWNGAAAALGLNAQTRAEALSLEQWVALTNHVRPLPALDRRKADAEWFPVVDARDIVLHSAHRREVHGNNLRHRAVNILLFNTAGELFLQKRSRTKDRHPLVWDSSAAGHVDAGEAYDTTAVRELEEELGVTEVSLERVKKLPATERTGWEFIWLYSGRHDGPFRLNREEIETGKYFPTEIVTRWTAARPDDFAPGFVECWKAYRETRGNG
jgi:16S rRNA (adenine1518-N6/adenine1519-N6)-dimethyltransferase